MLEESTLEDADLTEEINQTASNATDLPFDIPLPRLAVERTAKIAHSNKNMSYAVDALRGFVTLEDGGYKPPPSQLRKSYPQRLS